CVLCCERKPRSFGCYKLCDVCKLLKFALRLKRLCDICNLQLRFAFCRTSLVCAIPFPPDVFILGAAWSRLSLDCEFWWQISNQSTTKWVIRLYQEWR